ncbi:MAG: MerR family transcriptional regulator [Paenibacillus sp.]|jgi:DNA-binding transcriptional MerR regulator|uniref:MerR family transcriptional regulator n=1 Tax=Paenibacillus sp. TaxID=58172 RepID=UPI0028FE9399|nr:MerR family transcriptional regulator [Paenibacillus sp.]MDU2240678.1 MerR family transcriptional regulator [Paenibacillus sp.]
MAKQSVEGPTFTIKQAADLTGITEDTIRYYEKIALLPRAERKENGHRVYRQEDLDTIKLVNCLKKTGMPLDEMRPFLKVSADADPGEYPELVEQMEQHRANIVEQIASLQQVVEFIDLKLKQGKYRVVDCEAEGVSGSFSDGKKAASPAKPLSTSEMRYFSASPSESRY